MARRATSLGPKPSLFYLFCFFCFCFFCLVFFCFFVVFLFVFFGGFKGQVRWPKGPPHLALNPPYLICFCFVWFLFFVLFFCFLVFASSWKTLFSPPKKGIFVYFFCVSLCFSFALFHFLSFFVSLLFFSWVHQNRAIPCGCGGDFYRSEKNRCDFFLLPQLACQACSISAWFKLKSQERLFCWQNYWQIQQFCVPKNPWENSIFKCDEVKKLLANSAVWKITVSGAMRAKLLGDSAVLCLSRLEGLAAQNSWKT